MKYVRFTKDGKKYFGRLEDRTVFYLNYEPWHEGKETGEQVNLSEIDLISPCKPNNIIGVALNYPGIGESSNQQGEPLIFLKSPSSVIGDGQRIISPFLNQQVWGEPELAIVLGPKLAKTSKKSSRYSILGYTIANDVTCSNINGRDHHLARSKSADTFCVLGPFIDTDFLPSKQIIRGYQDGILIREGLLSERIFGEIEILSWLSNWLSLKAGDVILTGTPSRTRDRMFLENGSVFTCEIEGLGNIENPFSRAK